MFKSRPADALALLTPFYDQFATTVQHLPAIGRLNLINHQMGIPLMGSWLSFEQT